MTHSIRFRPILSLVVATVGLSILPYQVWAVGISPPLVVVDSLVAGDVTEAEFSLVRVPGEQGDIVIKAEITGSAVDMLSVPERVTMDADDTVVEFPVTITPTETANGTYTGTIQFVPSAVTTDGVQVSVLTGAQGTLEYTVLNNAVVDYVVTITDTQYAAGVLTVEGEISNNGEVDWQPDSILLQVPASKDSTQNQIVAAGTIPHITPGAAEIFSLSATVSEDSAVQLVVQSAGSVVFREGVLLTDDSLLNTVANAHNTADVGATQETSSPLTSTVLSIALAVVLIGMIIVLGVARLKKRRD